MMIIKVVTPECNISHPTLQAQMELPTIQATQDTPKTLAQEVQT